MSIIREVLSLPDRVEAQVKELTIIPPSDPVLPYRVQATLLNDEVVSLDVYTITLEKARARISTINIYALEDKKVVGYAREIKFYFPNGAWINYDFGILRIEE